MNYSCDSWTLLVYCAISVVFSEARQKKMTNFKKNELRKLLEF